MGQWDDLWPRALGSPYQLPLLQAWSLRSTCPPPLETTTHRTVPRPTQCKRQWMRQCRRQYKGQCTSTEAMQEAINAPVQKHCRRQSHTAQNPSTGAIQEAVQHQHGVNARGNAGAQGQRAGHHRCGPCASGSQSWHQGGSVMHRGRHSGSSRAGATFLPLLRDWEAGLVVTRVVIDAQPAEWLELNGLTTGLSQHCVTATSRQATSHEPALAQWHANPAQTFTDTLWCATWGLHIYLVVSW